MNSLLAIVIVLALVGALAWLLRHGGLGRFAPRAGVVGVETAISLGERRQLVIVAVEGRRLLLGVTSAQVTFVTELQPRRESDLQAVAAAQPVEPAHS
jgi:flagellar protein FliO/FliZ